MFYLSHITWMVISILSWILLNTNKKVRFC
jgi:hypothetical protein